MRKRLAKKLDKQCNAIQKLSEALNHFCGEMQTSTKRLQGLLSEMNGNLSRFPNVVKDWATCPPIHQGEYVIWFVRKGKAVQTRKYLFHGMEWYNGQGAKVDLRKLRPSMWMQVPIIDPAVLEVYERRES